MATLVLSGLGGLMTIYGLGARTGRFRGWTRSYYNGRLDPWLRRAPFLYLPAA